MNMAWDWGDVPDDPDVPAASRLLGKAGERAPDKKRHHFVAVTYLQGFGGADGKVWAYYLDNPREPKPSQPAAIGFRNRYYSPPRTVDATTPPTRTCGEPLRRSGRRRSPRCTRDGCPWRRPSTCWAWSAS